MPLVNLSDSPHAPGVSPVQIHYRDIGRGPTVVFLHGGWGYGAYPIEPQIEALSDTVRFVIPDRSGHGGSSHFESALPIDFHHRAAEESLLVLDALKIERATFWGHSDGAVIAAYIGLHAPKRCDQLILEAFHFFRDKPNSRSFFQKFARHPEEVSEKMHGRLLDDHGTAHWKKVVQRNCKVWLDLADESSGEDEDLYGGRLGELRMPVTFMHGRSDPRTEPGEIERAHRKLVRSQVHFLERGRHSPHSEKASVLECNELLRKLII